MNRLGSGGLFGMGSIKPVPIENTAEEDEEDEQFDQNDEERKKEEEEISAVSFFSFLCFFWGGICLFHLIFVVQTANDSSRRDGN